MLFVANISERQREKELCERDCQEFSESEREMRGQRDRRRLRAVETMWET